MMMQNLKNAGSLTLLLKQVGPQDYIVMSGEEGVGRIYKKSVGKLKWVWGIFRACYTELPGLRLAGTTEAESQLAKNWTRVEAAGLQKRSPAKSGQEAGETRTVGAPKSAQITTQTRGRFVR
jgi:hypothetical protein